MRSETKAGTKVRALSFPKWLRDTARTLLLTQNNYLETCTMSQPIQMPNVGGLSLAGSAGSASALALSPSSPLEAFSPPKHHYPIPSSPSSARRTQNGGFSPAQNTQNGFEPGRSPKDRARSLSLSSQPQPKQLTPFVPRIPEENTEDEDAAKEPCKILLLENVRRTCMLLLASSTLRFSAAWEKRGASMHVK